MTSSATVIIDPSVIPSVSIATGIGDVVCAGTLLTITAAPVNGGTAPVYSWTLNGIPVSVSGSAYTYLPSDGDHVNVVLTSSAPCAVPASVSSSLSLSVFPYGAPAVNISATPADTVCAGTLVHYTSTYTFGGTAPELTWVVNTSIMGSGSTFLYTPANHDHITCILGSNYHCRTADSGTSNTINAQVMAPTTPNVFVTAHPGATISTGDLVTMTTSVTGGGVAPYYQWYVNGVPVPGAVFSTFPNGLFADNDSVSCTVTTAGVCYGYKGSGYAKIHITHVGISQVIAAGSDIRLVPNPNSGTFTVKGTLGSVSDEEVMLVVTDMLGEVVYSSRVTAQNGVLNEQVLLNNNLANGMYLLNVRSGNETAVFHFVMEK